MKTRKQIRRAWNNRAYRDRCKQRMLNDVMFEQSRREFSGLCVSSNGMRDEIQLNNEWLDAEPKHYAGLRLEVNDHGNVTLYRQFRNGSLHEIASRV